MGERLSILVGIAALGLAGFCLHALPGCGTVEDGDGDADVDGDTDGDADADADADGDGDGDCLLGGACTCGGEDCVCTQTCDATCTGALCGITFQADSCNVDCAGTDECSAVCNGDACYVDCADTEDCSVICNGSCAVDCGSATLCTVLCNGMDCVCYGSKCDLDCLYGEPSCEAGECSCE